MRADRGTFEQAGVRATRPALVPAAVVLALLVATVVGWSFRFGIVVDDLDSHQPSFRFKRTVFVSWKVDSPIELNQFLVVQMQEGAWDYKRPMWAIGMAPGSDLQVERIQYGRVAPGFEEAVPPGPLVTGVPYLAVGFGAGSGGSKEFVLRHGVKEP
jgi:hypothetical protein